MTMEPHTPGDEFLDIFDDVPDAAGRDPTRSWKILVVDDDEDVHNATRMAVSGVKILDRPVTLLHARSGKEGLEVARANSEIAVALIDVVMERPDAGLNLVRELRDAGFAELRIVLRTGQPGYAPELKVVSEYEIDDYKTKQDLTRTGLLTTLISAVRAYEQIRALSRSREGLEMIVESATELFQRTNLELFSRGVLTQICGILSIDENGVVCVRKTGNRGADDTVVVSAAGRFSDLIGRSVSEIDDLPLRRALQDANGSKEPIIENGFMAIYFPSDGNQAMWGLIETDSRLSDSDMALLRLFITNISVGFENLSLVERLDDLAYVDHFLQVPNLNAFMKALQAREGDLAHVASTRIAFVGIDDLGDLIATYGLDVTLALLKTFYDLLVQKAGSDSILARIGDGLFAILAEEASLTRDAIGSLLAVPIQVDGITIPISATAALIDFADVEGTPGAVLRKAMAFFLHLNQHRPGECVECDQKIRDDVERTRVIRAALETVSETSDGLEVYLQPKFDLLSGAVTGAEALLRWTLDGEFVSPAEFIPIAESAGKTEFLTEFVLREVGRWMADRDGAPIRVAVNLSMADLNGPGFSERLLEGVREVGLSPETIEFEVTEGIGMSSSPWAGRQVEALRAEGFLLSIDDFGTGYSSLGQFDRMPVDTVKIDRSFVTGLEVGTARHSLAATIMAMVESLGVGCVAEGIETEDQKQALVFLGCKTGQGYLMGRPTPIGAFDGAFISHG
ncbi:EAL domain-containing protein [Nisaea sediminum]|uniref:EAL domain-containing protein n=1 Tax=Nisaea sediminum TaxID=2775867 RepID=UPI0018692914|nr:EAL domain-containing protein [Nisaea sediminum]